MQVDFEKAYRTGEKVEYFSKFHLIWKPVLITDNITKLLKSGYKLRIES